MENERVRGIARASIVGIVVNLLLTIVKAVVGFITGSVAIINDAISNLNDLLNGIITMIGIIIAGKQPDREHPYGYGQIEYVSTTSLAVMELLAGITALIQSVKRILNPDPAEYTQPLLLLLGGAMVVRWMLALYLEHAGKEYHSEGLLASCEDTYLNAAASLATLIAGGIQLWWKIDLDAWFGIGLAIVIIYSSLLDLYRCLGDIVGRSVDARFADPLRKTISEMPEVKGVYDLMLHRYGVEKVMGSVHVEFRDTLSAKEIHQLTRNIAYRCIKDFGVLLTVGIYASNTDDPYTKEMLLRLKKVCQEYPEILQLHGFYLDEEKEAIFFDIVVDFTQPNPVETKRRVAAKVRELYPQYQCCIVTDRFYSK